MFRAFAILESEPTQIKLERIVIRFSAIVLVFLWSQLVFDGGSDRSTRFMSAIYYSYSLVITIIKRWQGK